MALRDDIDQNATILDNSRANTDTYLNYLHQRAKEVEARLNDKMIVLNEYEIAWNVSDRRTDQNPYGTVEVVTNTRPTGAVGTSSIESINGYTFTNQFDTWTYHYFNSLDYADERIIGVFDDEGNAIQVDTHRTGGAGAVKGWDISVDLDVIENNGVNINNLAGKTWTILVASTIKFQYTEAEKSGQIKIGGATAAARTPDPTPAPGV